MTEKAAVATLGLGLLMTISPAQARAATLSVQPVTTTTSVGDAVTLNVVVSDVTGLYAFQFDVDFNPAVLSATGVTEGPFLPSGGSTFSFPGQSIMQLVPSRLPQTP